jgi:hypothetical protein
VGAKTFSKFIFGVVSENWESFENEKFFFANIPFLFFGNFVRWFLVCENFFKIYFWSGFQKLREFRKRKVFFRNVLPKLGKKYGRTSEGASKNIFEVISKNIFKVNSKNIFYVLI